MTVDWKLSLKERAIFSQSDPQRGMRTEGCLIAFPAVPSFQKEDLLTYLSIQYSLPITLTLCTIDYMYTNAPVFQEKGARKVSEMH